MIDIAKEVAMLTTVLFTIAGAITILWGSAHLFPTRSVADGFGDISIDNRRILVMEWINEGLALIFIGGLILFATYTWGPADRHTIQLVWGSALMLVAMAILSLFTGFRVDFLPYKLCPFLFGLSAGLLILGTIV
jgi:hypothetical protein